MYSTIDYIEIIQTHFYLLCIKNQTFSCKTVQIYNNRLLNFNEYLCKKYKYDKNHKKFSLNI